MLAAKKEMPIPVYLDHNKAIDDFRIFVLEQINSGEFEVKELQSYDEWEQFQEKYDDLIEGLKSKFKDKYQEIYHPTPKLVECKILGSARFSINELISMMTKFCISLEKQCEAQPIHVKYFHVNYPKYDKKDTFLRLLAHSKYTYVHHDRYAYKGYLYEINDKRNYTNDEINLVIFEAFDRERKYFEKLKTKFDDSLPENSAYDRPRIPEKIRVEVWRRDGGKCARCGSREKLEYDHIVPISRGGSNTTRNIELLCEKCNRSKSNNVA